MCLYSAKTSECMKNKFAEKISILPVDNLQIQKPVLPIINSKLTIVDCSGPRSSFWVFLIRFLVILSGDNFKSISR